IMVVCTHYPAKTCPVLKEAYLGEGHLVASGKFDGMSSEKAKQEITKFVKGKKVIKYHLRDWLISRQRYWGPPIPMIHCEKCGIVPVPEKDLPIELPDLKNFQPTGVDEESPLASVKSFVNVTCPECKGKAKRETDVSDTFLDSAWYFLRYPSTRSARSGQVPFDPQLTRKWLPVDMYIGGQEHAVLHLMYARFITMALKDMGHIDFDEPFDKFRAHGLVIKDGSKMSKSKGNVVNPDEYFQKYGADTVRMYLMFLGPFSEGGDWSDKGIVGISRFLNRVWNAKTGSASEVLRHRTIKKVTEDMEGLRYNTAIAALMEYFNESAVIDETLLLLLAPLAPHVSAELWERSGYKGSIHEKPWPKYDAKKIVEKKIRLVLQVNGKVRDVVEVAANISEKQAKETALQSEKIQKWLVDKKIKKTIVVPGKLVNIVI
ncbi:class I tRNA ligase family protein, partial [Patescibacteria group bacterium]|nr:class I tRNA ligase family protein [Patescibacteria group bacterium]